ncbi:MAG: hypothetical protein FWD61_08910 [Phycisphaerales bacterium]|nr:hypothetical protein [Phycisphaerales bacterium]
MSEMELLELCKLPADTSEDVRELLRLAALLLEKSTAGQHPEAAVTLVAAAMGQIVGCCVVSLPFGYSGPRVEHQGWIKRDNLEAMVAQLWGIIAGGKFHAELVPYTIDKAKQAYWLREDNYDAWRPGMESGTGWTKVVQAQPVGIVRARELAMASSATAATPAPNVPIPWKVAASQSTATGPVTAPTPNVPAPLKIASPPPVPVPPPAPAPSPAPAPASTQPPTDSKSELQSWTQTDLDNAIRQYKAERAGAYADLCEAVRKGSAAAKQRAKEVYGRNAIARALGVKSKAMVSKSQAWLAIAGELNFPLNRSRRTQGTRHTQWTGKIGHDIAVEEKSATPEAGADNAPAEQKLETAERQETIRRINAMVRAGKTAKKRAENEKAAEALIQTLQRGECTDDQARQVAEMSINADTDADADFDEDSDD